MIFNRIKNEFSLLINSSRRVWTYELAYKLVAFAVMLPLLAVAVNLCMKAAGINYLTNEYLLKMLMNPLVIVLVFLFVCVFVIYCAYEMTFLAVCFETRRNECDATIVDVLYNAFKVFCNVFRLRHILLGLFYLLSILACNVTVLINILYSETNINLFRMYVLRNHWYVKLALAAIVLIIYVVVILGIYTMNICSLEGKGFRAAYKKSVSIVIKHFPGTMFALIVYNLLILAVIGITYVLISLILVAGVKILNMAYIGNAVFLSALRTERFIIKCILVCVAIPLSFSAISYIYYKYAGTDEITFKFIDVKEGSERRRTIAYRLVVTVSCAVFIAYIGVTFNDNPFENVAIFHETKVVAHRGASSEAPENTMAAFQKAIDDMADCIEIDVQLTKDGRVVVMHDYSLYRTTGVDNYVVNMTFQEIRKLDAGAWFSEEYAGEKVPSLEEVLELAEGKIDLNIELKPTDEGEELAKKTVEIIEKYNMESDCVITSFSNSALVAVKECNPDIRVGYILSVAYGEFYEMSNIDFFSVNAAFLSKRTIDAIHNAGKQVYAWTVNNSEAIQNLTNKGVDGVISDEPVLARETIYSRDTSETLINMIRYVFNR